MGIVSHRFNLWQLCEPTCFPSQSYLEVQGFITSILYSLLFSATAGAPRMTYWPTCWISTWSWLSWRQRARPLLGHGIQAKRGYDRQGVSSIP
jgi:hypothetical protein